MDAYLEEEVLKEIIDCCQKYHYHAFLRFDEIHIQTRYESWYFVPHEEGTIRLMHGNRPGIDPNGWHCQFYQCNMTYEDLIQYIYEHEQSKYSILSTPFKFTKHGKLKRAIA